MYAKINGTRIYFDVEGMGSVPDGPIMRQKPVCFVLHGGPGGTHTGYKPYLTPLAEIMQLVYIDNRGSGFSDEGPQSTYNLENNVNDLEALRQYLGLDKIVIMGQSYGGMVAQSYALQYPDSLAGLILLTTSPDNGFLERAKQNLLEKGNEEQKRIGMKIFEGSFQSNEELNEYYRLMTSMYAVSYRPPQSEEEKQMERDALTRTKRSYQAINEGFHNFLRHFDVREQLSGINVPTLIIAGRHDWMTPVEDSIEIANRIPDNEFVIFEQSSHDIIRDEYDLFLSTVSDFVTRNLL